MTSSPQKPRKSTDSTTQMGTDSIWRLLFRFSIPSIVGMLVQALYNIVDRVFIGYGVGAHGIGAVTLGFPIMMVMISFSILIGVGANTLFSIRLGEGKRHEAERILGNAFVLLFFFPLVASIFALVWLDPLLRLVGTSTELLPYARTYTRIIIAGSALSTSGYGLSHFVRSDGHPVISMLAMLIGAVTNTLLDALFIFGFKWGIAGAAWATVIAKGLSFAWSFSYFLSPRANTRLRRRNLRLEFRFVRPIVAIGFAPFAMHFANSILNSVLNRGLGRYGGDDAIAIMGIIMSFGSLIFMPTFGITQAVQPLMGYNYGARQYRRVRQFFWSAAGSTTILMTLGWIVTRLYPAAIIRMFLPAGSDLIADGTHALRIFMLALPIIGFPISGGHLFQAIGKPVQAAILALSRQVLLFIPFIILFPRIRDWGLDGIFYAAPASDFLTFLLALWLVGQLLRQLRKLDDAPLPSTPATSP